MGGGGRVSIAGGRGRSGRGDSGGAGRAGVAVLAGAARVVDVEAVGPLEGSGLAVHGDSKTVNLGLAEGAVDVPGVGVGADIKGCVSHGQYK